MTLSLSGMNTSMTSTKPERETLMTNTIEAGKRLIPLGPTTHWTKKRIPAHDLKADILQIEKLIKLYNIRVNRLTYAERVNAGLHERIDLLRSYSSTIMGLATIPLPPQARSGTDSADCSTATLRSIAKVNRMPARQRWTKFPPTTLDERRQMALETSRAPLSIVPQGTTKSASTKAFENYLRRQAQSEAKLNGTLAASYLSDTEWKAKQRKAYDEMMAIDLEIEL
jgi:hypothetical protein